MDTVSLPPTRWQPRWPRGQCPWRPARKPAQASRKALSWNKKNVMLFHMSIDLLTLAYDPFCAVGRMNINRRYFVLEMNWTFPSHCYLCVLPRFVTRCLDLYRNNVLLLLGCRYALWQWTSIVYMYRDLFQQNLNSHAKHLRLTRTSLVLMSQLITIKMPAFE